MVKKEKEQEKLRKEKEAEKIKKLENDRKEECKKQQEDKERKEDEVKRLPKVMEGSMEKVVDKFEERLSRVERTSIDSTRRGSARTSMSPQYFPRMEDENGRQSNYTTRRSESCWTDRVSWGGQEELAPE